MSGLSLVLKLKERTLKLLSHVQRLSQKLFGGVSKKFRLKLGLSKLHCLKGFGQKQKCENLGEVRTKLLKDGVKRLKAQDTMEEEARRLARVVVWSLAVDEIEFNLSRLAFTKWTKTCQKCQLQNFFETSLFLMTKMMTLCLTTKKCIKTYLYLIFFREMIVVKR